MSHKGNDYLVDNLMDREVKKPEMIFNSPMVCDTLDEVAKAEIRVHNQMCADWEAYIKDIGGIAECVLLHEKRCQCQNDE